MSYIDIIVTAAYPDRIETTVGDKQSFIHGRWNYEVAVVDSDLTPEDFQRFVRDALVFRVEITEEK